MKILLTVISFFTLCTLVAQENNVIEGNGNLVKREVPVSAFEGLKASGIYELHLAQGSKEAVTIEADENLQEYFDVRNDGNALVIDMKKLDKKGMKTKNTMKIFITFRQLKNMELKNIGNVVAEQNLTFSHLELKNSSIGDVRLKLTAQNLKLENKSVGNLKLSGKVNDMNLTNKGVGSIEAGDLVVQTVYIENNGVGNAEVNAEKELKVKDNLMGKVKNKGAAPVRKMNKVRV